MPCRALRGVLVAEAEAKGLVLLVMLGEWETEEVKLSVGDVLAVSDTEVVTLDVRDREAVGVEVWDGDGVRLGVTLRDGTLAVALGDGEAVGDKEGDSDTDGDTEEVEEADLDGLGVFVDDLLRVNVAAGVELLAHTNHAGTNSVVMSK